MRKILRVLLTIALILPMTSKISQARVFETCVTAEDETYTEEQLREEARRLGSTAYVNANGDLLVRKGTSISETVDCEDGAFYAWVTLGIIAGAAIGASVTYYLITSGFFQDKSKSFAESVFYKKEPHNFTVSPTFDPENKSTGLRISIKY